MKGNFKKLVLALCAGLLLGGAAMAEPKFTVYKDGVWVVDTRVDNNQRYWSFEGTVGSPEELCITFANWETKGSNGGRVYTVLDSYVQNSWYEYRWNLNCTMNSHKVGGGATDSVTTSRYTDVKRLR